MSGFTNFHTSMANSRSEQGSSGCQNVNKNNKLKAVFWWITY